MDQNWSLTQRSCLLVVSFRYVKLIVRTLFKKISFQTHQMLSTSKLGIKLQNQLFLQIGTLNSDSLCEYLKARGLCFTFVAAVFLSGVLWSTHGSYEPGSGLTLPGGLCFWPCCSKDHFWHNWSGNIGMLLETLLQMEYRLEIVDFKRKSLLPKIHFCTVVFTGTRNRLFLWRRSQIRQSKRRHWVS